MNTTINPNVARRMFPVPPSDEHLECPYCHKHPNDLIEYVESAKEMNMSAVEYVKREEGTYCQYTGYFTCTICYVEIGLPTRGKLHTMFPSFRMQDKPLPGQNNVVIFEYLLGKI